MEVLFLCILLAFASIYVLFHLRVLSHKHRPLMSAGLNLPPGNTGWPLIGETLSFLSAGWRGEPEKFFSESMETFSRDCFKTSILGEAVTVLCGPAGNKFVFGNENKLVTVWWPANFHKIFSPTVNLNPEEEGKRIKKLLPQFLKAEALRGYIGIMDDVARRHFASSWENNQQVTVYPLAKRFTFSLACRLFLSVEDIDQMTHFTDQFHCLVKGILSMPIDLPGTPFHRAIKAAQLIRKELKAIVSRRKLDLAEGTAVPNQGILCHMLTTTDEDGQFLTESDIANKIMGLLVAGYATASGAITSVVHYLAELPHIYEAVYEEQMEIAKTKGPDEKLNWEDIQKMKYSWNVACEALRLAPPLLGAFREASHDFTYAGFSVPKGKKLYWSTHTTHRNPDCFPEPEKFDPSRFEGKGPAPYTYVPFGGGPRMCPGKEYARLEMLVFMHHIVKRFRWQKLIPNEKIIVNPLPTSAKGLPIRLTPHN